MEKRAVNVFKLDFTDPRHAKLLSAIRMRLKISETAMAQYYTRWTRAEEEFLAYMPERDIDAQKRAKREGGLPQYTTIVVPYSYALLMTAHT